MGYNTRGISQTTRFKRRPSASGRPGSSGLNKLPSAMDQRRMEWTAHSSFSPTAAPFNSTSFLIRHKNKQQEKEEAPGAFTEYGSNVGNMITGCPFTHNQDCRLQSQAQRSIVSGMLHDGLDSQEDVLLMHLEFQGLHVTDSGSDMEIDNLPKAGDLGDSAFKHRRVRSFMDDNFELFD